MKKKTVLIVDDDREVQSYLADVLGADGWEVLLETDGDWALKTFQSRRVDVILLDILLPVINGFQVAEALRAMPKGKNIPIVMLSGVYRGKAQRNEVINKYGLLEYINKPVQGAVVKEILKKHFGEDYPEANGLGKISHKSSKEGKGLSENILGGGGKIGGVGKLKSLKAGEEKAGEDKPKKGKKHREQRRSRHTLRLANAAARGLEMESTEKAKRVDRGRAPLRGNLSEVDFPFVLHELSRVQATGALFVIHDKTKKIVFFRNGMPVFVKSNLLRECLGQILVREEVIPAQVCDESLAKMKKSGRMQGAELIEMGVLEASDIINVLGRQMELKLIAIFGLEGGEYAFKENVRSPSYEVRSKSSLASLIYKGVRTATSQEKIEEELKKHAKHYPAPSQDPTERFQVMITETEEEKVFLESMDGSRTLEDYLQKIRDKSIADKAKEWKENDEDWLRAKAAFYAALSSGMLELWDHPVHKGRLDLRYGKLDGNDLGLLSEYAVQEHLGKQLLQLKDSDYFTLLGVEPDVDDFGLDQAFAKVAVQYHPDRFVGLGEGPFELAEALFEVYKETYLVLRDKKKRKSYKNKVSGGKWDSKEKQQKTGQKEAESNMGEREGLEDGEAHPAALSAAVVTLDAMKEYETGLARESEQNWEVATEKFKHAVEMKPTRGDFRAKLGWAIMNLSPKSSKNEEQAQEELNKAKELEPGLELSYLYMGYLLERRKDLDGAKKEFQKALHRNPSSRGARMALRRLTDR